MLSIKKNWNEFWKSYNNEIIFYFRDQEIFFPGDKKQIYAFQLPDILSWPPGHSEFNCQIFLRSSGHSEFNCQILLRSSGYSEFNCQILLRSSGHSEFNCQILLRSSGHSEFRKEGYGDDDKVLKTNKYNK